ncbi:DNA sulfur modification protein DndD [Gallaecimonas sp. GXIMD4217]|uniref:DNA sulfur modification protein DndD n=1 Tax=Gallaecimonas sp. GXIMD4217 TaxID=3131927 RepID=UPI00311AF02B
MIIKNLTLHNFRVFRGIHELDLAPRAEKHNRRPIILFGGLNGAGKTSILTAIRFALHGRQALGYFTSNADYIAALDGLLHRSNGSQADEASIRLTFTHAQDGVESQYQLIRSWKRGQKDRIKLSKDGTALSELNYDQCQGFLNELIPFGIADLFFFDGEKIAELAEDESGAVLKTAVRRLLGLDVINRLKSDLGIYLKRQGAEKLASNEQNELKQLEKSVQKHHANAEKHREQAEFAKAQLENYQYELRKLEQRLEESGGAFAKSRKEEEERAAQLVKEKDMLERAIRSEMEGWLPIALAPKTMATLLKVLEEESKAKRKQAFNAELSNFMDKLRQELGFRLAGSAPVAMEAIEDCMSSVAANSTTPVHLDVSDSEHRQIQAAVESLSNESYHRFSEAKQLLESVEAQLEQASVNIARAPAEEQLQDIFSQIRGLDQKCRTAKSDILEHLKVAKTEYRLAMEAARSVQKYHDMARSQQNRSEAITNAQAALPLLDVFSERLTQARVKQLEGTFAESYKRLARKDDLQISARINAKSFDVELINEAGQVINRKSLSAGEKQIYAIAILEALGKTSGKKLPVIIDTPLGRLDSKHRDKLIEHYFPVASHQVIILSTDTEVDEKYFKQKLVDDISHSYEIQFNGRTQSSTVSEGYFWHKEAV